MNRLTKVFLVLLRLAIGWHFLFEGLEKYESIYTGPTETNQPFTSAPYLRESTGPLGNFFRGQVGDPDQQALDRLTVQPLAPGQDAASTPPHLRMPPALDREWNDYFERFAGYYHLDDRQRDLAQKKLDQAKDQAVKWLLTGTREVKKTYPSGVVATTETTEEQVRDYRDKLAEVREIQNQTLPLLGREAAEKRLTRAKAEAARLRAELLAELDKDTDAMKAALKSSLTQDQKEKPPMPEPKVTRPVDWIDWTTVGILLGVGACLLLGLFSRTACVVGALFLLMLYLTMPPFPWLPQLGPTEGHYLFVNKNLIELLALLALATTRSGRWAGLDALLQFLNPWRWRARPPAAPARAPAEPVTP